MRVLDVSDLRARGFSDTQIFPDEVLIDAEQRVWDLIELFTGRKFQLFSTTLKLDGSGSEELYTHYNIVSISKLEVDNVGEISSSDYVVYNRETPSDFDYPYIAGSSVFPIGNQNVQVTGIFGDVNLEGLPFSPILEVAKRMLYILFEPLTSMGGSVYPGGGISPNSIKSEKTDKYEYVKFDKKVSDSLLSDPFINAILLRYRKGDDIVYGGWV